MPSSGGGNTARSSSSSHISSADVTGSVANSPNHVSGDSSSSAGLFRSRSVSNARQSMNTTLQNMMIGDTTDPGSSVDVGIGARFNLNKCRGLEGLDVLFGRGWSLDANTGIISVSDAAFLRITNQDPIEKWYSIDPEPIAR